VKPCPDVFPFAPAGLLVEPSQRLADYYLARKPFVVGVLFAAGIIEHIPYFPGFEGRLTRHPAIFWRYLLPYNRRSTER
jgi:hypothetical protein